MRIASTADSMEPWAVSMTTTTRWSTSRMRDNSSMPSMRGIFRSVTTMPGDHWRTRSRPSTPSAAESARKPHDATSSVSPLRACASSSTIRTFSCTFTIRVPSPKYPFCEDWGASRPDSLDVLWHESNDVISANKPGLLYPYRMSDLPAKTLEPEITPQAFAELRAAAPAGLTSASRGSFRPPACPIRCRCRWAT